MNKLEKIISFQTYKNEVEILSCLNLPKVFKNLKWKFYIIKEKIECNITNLIIAFNRKLKHIIKGLLHIHHIYYRLHDK